jgi:hypothetical protein
VPFLEQLAFAARQSEECHDRVVPPRGRRFQHDIESRSTRPIPGDRVAGSESILGGRAHGVKLPVYKNLLDINAGFYQVIRGLAAIRKHDAFLARELDHYSALTKEARAATNSYLIGVMEKAETLEAGRRFAKRREREQREE